MRVLVVVTLLAQAIAIPGSTQRNSPVNLSGPSYCGVSPSPEKAQSLQTQRQGFVTSYSLPDEPLQVDVNVVVVIDDESLRPPESLIQQQMIIINQAYNPHNVSFNLANLTYIISINMTRPDVVTLFDYTYPALHQGTFATLNLYILQNLHLYLGWLGYCSLPPTMPLTQPTSDSSSATPNPSDPQQPEFNYTLALLHDACVIDVGTLPGIGIPKSMPPEKAQGKTAVHEIGHWMGLLHVFYPESGSCVGSGDFVDDTPMQSRPNWGCPALGERDSCLDVQGYDSVKNYMDYVDDECMTEFTPGQGRRMKEMWAAYRRDKMIVPLSVE